MTNGLCNGRRFWTALADALKGGGRAGGGCFGGAEILRVRVLGRKAVPWAFPRQGAKGRDADEEHDPRGAVCSICV